MAVRIPTIAMILALSGICPVLPAAAQAPAPSPTPSAPAINPVPAPSEMVNLTMEQKHVIKEIIIKDMKTPTTQSAPAEAKAGEVVPSGIALQPMPVEVSAKVPQVRTHSYFVTGDKVVIVDPKDNKISTVVE